MKENIKLCVFSAACLASVWLILRAGAVLIADLIEAALKVAVWAM